MKPKKIMSIFLSLILVIMALASCAKNEPDPIQEPQNENGDKDDTPDIENNDEKKENEDKKDETPADPLDSLDYEAISAAPLAPITSGSWGARVSSSRSVYIYFSENEEGPYLNIVMQDFDPDYPEFALWGAGGTYTVKDGVITFNGETDGSVFVSKYSYELKNGYLYATYVGGNSCLFEAKGVKTTVFAPSFGADPETLFMAYVLAKVDDLEKAYAEKFWKIVSLYASMTYTVDQIKPENYENDDWYITVDDASMQRAAKVLFGKTDIPALPDDGSVNKIDDGYEIKFDKSVFDYVYNSEYVENDDTADNDIMITLYNKNAGVPYTWAGTYRMEEKDDAENEFDYFLTSVKYLESETQE